MKPPAHPLRRRDSLELALGVLALLGATYVLSRPGERSRAATLAPPEVRGEPARRAAAAIAAPDELSEEAPAEPARTPGSESERPQRASPPPVPQPAHGVEAPPPPSGELEVLVRDEHGRPVAGIALDLELRTVPDSSGPSDALPLTEADGRVRIPLARFAAPSWAVESYTYVLRARVPLRELPRIEFGSRAPGPGLVVLTLPLSGRVRVHVLDSEGAPVEDGAGVYAVLRGGGPDRVPTSADVRAGLAELPWVPLDATLELRAAYYDKRAESAWFELAGPTLPGEIVESELRLGESWPVLRFRVLNERGAPLASASLALRVSLPPLSPQIAHVTSSPEGWVELQLLERQSGRAERLLELAARQPVPRWGELLLPYELVRGAPTELGDIVLRPGPGWR